MSAEWSMEFVKEKGKDVAMVLQNLAVFMMGKLDKEFPVAMECVKEKAKDVGMVLQDWIVYATGKLDKEFPQEKRAEELYHRLKIASKYAIPTIALLWFFFGRGGGGRGARAKMMKAPGRDGYSIPRSPFEANPRAYFRDLRSTSP